MLKYGARKLFAPGYLLRYKSTQVTPMVLENINERGLLRVSGAETSAFLQGLITNDMRRLDDGATSLYAMLLNSKGRVMYDVVLYKSREKDVYYLECDVRAVSILKNHLKLYRVRRKIDIDDVVESTKVWALFNAGCDVDQKPTVSPVVKSLSNDVSVYPDPRLPSIGYRVLTNSNVESQDIIKSIDCRVIQSNDKSRYRVFRHKLGIGEGCDDIEPNKALPLEMNCDYLNGVSFQKGCYVGQELTARTFHTGVIRKRLMPVVFDDVPSTTLDIDQTITDESGRSVGKLKGHDQIYGLGLIRITEALRAKSLHVTNDYTCKVIKPWWWPSESVTEKASAR